MPVPKRKRSRARRDSRFAHKAMVMHAITACKECGAPLLPHTLCHICGCYKGKKVASTKFDRKVTRFQTRQAVVAAKNKKNTVSASAESSQ